MKALRGLSGAPRPEPSSSRPRRSSSRPPDPPSVPPSQKPTSAFAFTQINVTNFDRAEAFFEKVFGWRFIGEPTCPVFVAPPPPKRDWNGSAARMAPPIAPPPDHRVNYFTQRKEDGDGNIVGGLFKFGANSTARNYGGRVRKEVEEEEEIPGVIQYVAVDDLVIALNAVRLAGGRTVVQPWMERDEMAKFALFSDTEGNVFGLIQYLM